MVIFFKLTDNMASLTFPAQYGFSQQAIESLLHREIPNIGVLGPAYLDNILAALFDRCMLATIKRYASIPTDNGVWGQMALDVNDVGAYSHVWQHMDNNMEEYQDIWLEASGAIEHMIQLGASPFAMSALMSTEVLTLAIRFEIRSVTLSLLHSPNMDWNQCLNIPMETHDRIMCRPVRHVPYAFCDYHQKTWLPFFLMVEKCSIMYLEAVMETGLRRTLAQFRTVFHQQNHRGQMIWSLVFQEDQSLYARTNNNMPAMIPQQQSRAWLWYRMVNEYTDFIRHPDMQTFIDLPDAMTDKTPFQLFCCTRYAPKLVGHLWAIIRQAQPTWDLADKEGKTALHYTMINPYMINVWMTEWMTSNDISVTHEDAYGNTPFHRLVLCGHYKTAYELYQQMMAKGVSINIVTPHQGDGTFIHRMMHTTKDDYYVRVVNIVVAGYAPYPEEFVVTNSTRNTLIMESLKHRKPLLVEALAEVCPHHFHPRDFDYMRLLKQRGTLSARLTALFPDL